MGSQLNLSVSWQRGSMQLSALELDLLGDMREDDHALHEIFAFVRLHHGRDPSTVRAVGRELLSTWIARGWLAVESVPSSPATYRASDVSEVLALVDAADLEQTGWRGADTWLTLTAAGRALPPWSAPAS